MNRVIKLISVLLVTFMLLALVGCGNSNNNINNNQNDDPNLYQNMNNIEVGEATGFSNFDSAFIKYISTYMNGGSNYMVSPLSFEYALALLAAGSAGNTQKEILDLFGYKSMDEFSSHLSKFTVFANNLNKEYESELFEYNQSHVKYITPTERRLEIANSIWKNSDKSGKIKNSYILYVNSNFGADSYNVNSVEFPIKVNEWVNNKTHGMIPKLMDEGPSDLAFALVNTLYLKDSWQNAFNSNLTTKDDFTLSNGNKVQKDFMHNVEIIKYYEDKDSKLVVVPLYNNINVAFVLGDSDNLLDKINASKLCEVTLDIPKFEIETSIKSEQMIDFLEKNDVSSIFGLADFSPMLDSISEYSVTDIIQKTKIKVEEYGLEAAAATLIAAKETSVGPGPVYEVKEFRADRPFEFAIYTQIDETPYMLFYGQLNK